MRKVREVLRLRHALGLSYREISQALGVGKTAAGEIVRRADFIVTNWRESIEMERQAGIFDPIEKGIISWDKVHGYDQIGQIIKRSSHAARNAALASSRLSATPPLGPCDGAT